MKIARHQIFEKKEKYFVILLVLAVAAVIVTFVGGISRWTVEGNVVRRVNDESQFLAKQQAELINKVIEEQFDKVSTISGMMEKGLSFYDEKDRKILQAFVEKNNIGIMINSLNEIPEKIKRLSPDDYAKMVDNVSIVKEKITRGEFLKEALRKIEQIV